MQILRATGNEQFFFHIPTWIHDDWFDNFVCPTSIHSFFSSLNNISSTLNRVAGFTRENLSINHSLLFVFSVSFFSLFFFMMKFITLSCYHLEWYDGCCMKITSWKYYTHCHNSITIRGIIIGGSEANWEKWKGVEWRMKRWG